MSEGDEIKMIITHLQEARDTRILGTYHSDKWFLESQPGLLFLNQSQLCT